MLFVHLLYIPENVVLLLRLVCNMPITLNNYPMRNNMKRKGKEIFLVCRKTIASTIKKRLLINGGWVGGCRLLVPEGLC